MKIALITNYWKNSDGIKTYLVNLVDAMKNGGTDVSVLFQRSEDPEHFQGGKNKIAFSFACYCQFQKIHPKVICSQETWYCLIPGVLYNKLHGCMPVHTFHTEPDRRLPLPPMIFFQSLLNACECVPFVSKGLQERIVEVDGLSFSKTANTYGGVQACGISDEEFKQFREHFGIVEDATTLLDQSMIAHPYTNKGLKLLICAVRLLQETHPKILLIPTREGKYSEKLKAFARELGVEDRFTSGGKTYLYSRV